MKTTKMECLEVLASSIWPHLQKLEKVLLYCNIFLKFNFLKLHSFTKKSLCRTFKMIVSQKFLKLLVQAMNLYSLICGQLFTFDVRRQKFVILDKPGAMLGFKARSVLLLLVSITSFIRVIKLMLSNVHIDNSNNTAVEINISIMLIVINIAASEYYRLRGDYPEDFVTFMNGAMGIEKKYMNGKLK